MRKTRPPLQVGDVVRLSKNGIRNISRWAYCGISKDTTMVVAKVGAFLGSTSDGKAKITCMVIAQPSYGGKERGFKLSFDRKFLWRTGYNVGDKNSGQFSGRDANQWLQNDRRQEIGYDAKAKTLSIPVSKCICDLDVLMGLGCKCGGR